MADNNQNGHEHGPDIDEISGVETTGHSWDGIKELNNPLPRWWLWSFYATIVWAVIYTIAYPAWPLINSSTAGVLGWSSRGALSESIDAAKQAQSVYLAKLEATDVGAIQADGELTQFAVSGGSAAFKVNCVQCHGSGATGSPGYPNLNDDDWIWGGTVDDIYLTLQHGIRHPGDDDTRVSDMPAFGADEILSSAEISDVAWFVRKVSNQEFDAEAAGRGEALYADNCAACHGDAGEGMREVGAPRLSDAIWLYGGEHADIVAQVTRPRQGVMPAWGERLGDTTIKQLAVFVHSLGGGE
ncbi:MAG: cytochrome-c oxidase, cbb3-type subunit III [Nitratireductor sp.]|nr:cytochrome-c oxidase, cbb3-type subunit III [Nitratireductor sp.]